MWVKICGLQEQQEVINALDAGADALGMIVGGRSYSPQAASPAQLAALLDLVPAERQAVLVTELSNPVDLLALWRLLPADAFQLSNQRLLATPAHWPALADLPLTTIPVVELRGPQSLTPLTALGQYFPRVIVDRPKKPAALSGGEDPGAQPWRPSVEEHWQLAAQAVSAFPGEVVLAGGLNADNVATAIATVAPAGVDANSGLLGPSGVKGRRQCQQFVAAARQGGAQDQV